MRRLKKEWLDPDVRPRRVIAHWTAGGYRVSDLDREHYHFIVGGDGKVEPGFFRPADNMPCIASRGYAAHTWHCNTDSIGVAVACMAGATQGNAGSYPMTESQWKILAEVVADLVEFYGIPLASDRVLGHGEVTWELGIDQAGKWDPLWLPWAPTLDMRAAGTLFRAEVAKILGRSTVDSPFLRPERGPDEELPEATVIAPNGQRLAGVLANESALVQLRPLVVALGNVTIPSVQGGQAHLRRLDGTTRAFPLLLVDGSGFAPLRDVATWLGLTIAWEPRTKTARLSIPK